MLCPAEDFRGCALGADGWELLPALAGPAASWGGGSQEGHLWWKVTRAEKSKAPEGPRIAAVRQF